MPHGKPITPKEFAAIKQSVAKACGEKWLELTPVKDFRKMARKAAQLSPEKQLQLRMLFSLRFMESRDLRKQPIPEVIAKAVEANDLKFFIQLGTVLSKDSARLEDYHFAQDVAPTLTRVEAFLLSHWATAKDGLPELFYLTPQGLADVCNHYLETRHITAEAVVKLRQRLGLMPFKRQKIDVVRVGNQLRLQQLDKLSGKNPVHDK